MDIEVLKAAQGWLEQGLRCELVTVARTWGSSPRPPGSMLVICQDGRVVGSVSGGCIEDDLIAEVASARMQDHRPGIVTGVVPDILPSILPGIVRYGLSADEAHRFGLPCGGTIELVREPLSARSRIAELLQALTAQQLIERRLHLDTGEVILNTGLTTLPPQLVHIVGNHVISHHGPRWRLLLIGAGQLSAFLAQIATGMDYQVTVCDPREEFRNVWPVAAVPVIHAMPDDLVTEMRPDACTAVVALTHDPKLDDLALMEALRSPAFYVGAIGSRENNARRRQRLALFDLSEEDIGRLHGPVGLPIGSKTPAEIAISVMAEMTAVRHGIVVQAAMTY